MEEIKISGERQYDFVAAFPYIREAGTAGEEKAAEQIYKILEEAGIQGKIEPFSYEKICSVQAELQVCSPYQKNYPITAMLYDVPLELELEAPVLYVENADEISLSQATGKIILVNEPLKPDRLKRIHASGALAYLSVTGTPIDEGNDCIPAERRMGIFAKGNIPGARIHMRDAVELITQGAQIVKLKISQKMDKVSSSNIVVKMEGNRVPDEVMTLTAHYDSVPTGPGAYDNMAGCAIIMELCRYFAEHRPNRTMEFIWFGSEEKGLYGSRAYVEAHAEELQQHRFHMNVDLAGQMIGGTVAGVTAGQEVCDFILETARKNQKGLEILNQVWSSDSNTFAWKGIPAMTLNRDGFGMHTTKDTIAWISPWSLKRSAVILGLIAEACDESEEFPFERKMPENFQEQLEKFFD